MEAYMLFLLACLEFVFFFFDFMVVFMTLVCCVAFLLRSMAFAFHMILNIKNGVKSQIKATSWSTIRYVHISATTQQIITKFSAVATYVNVILCREYIYFKIITHLYHYASDKHNIQFF